MNLVPAPVVGAGGGGLIAGIRPEDLSLERRGDALEFDARVDVVEYLGDEQVVHLLVGEVPVVAKLPAAARVATGDERRFAVPRERVHLFDAESGRHL